MALLLTTTFTATANGTTYTDSNGDWLAAVSGAAANTPRVATSATHSGTGRGLQVSVIGDGTTSVYRSEYSGDGAGANATIGTTKRLVSGDERWFGFAVMCGKSNDLLTLNDPEIIWQCHISQAPGGTVNPPLSLVVEGNRVFIQHLYNTTSDDNPVLAQRAYVGQIIPGQWTSFVFHLKFNATAAGITQLYRDGRLVYDNQTDPNHYNRTTDSGGLGTRYFKFGCYVSGWSSTPPASGSARARRDWSFDQIRIGDAASSLTEVSPVIGVVAPSKPKSGPVR